MKQILGLAITLMFVTALAGCGGPGAGSGGGGGKDGPTGQVPPNQPQNNAEKIRALYREMNITITKEKTALLKSVKDEQSAVEVIPKLKALGERKRDLQNQMDKFSVDEQIKSGSAKFFGEAEAAGKEQMNAWLTAAKKAGNKSGELGDAMNYSGSAKK